jgi:imidazolonepropionase-like amidohydrolase
MRILVVLFLPAFLLTQAPTTRASLAITHVTVIDTANGSARGDMTVIIGGNRIISTGDSATTKSPRQISVVDGRGKFLIPGLWDMHVHMFSNSDRPGTDNSEYFFPLLVANGVIGVRDMWSDPEDIQLARRWNTEIEAGRLLAPHMIVSSRIVDGEPPVQSNALVVRNADEAREAVRELKASGAGFIKVVWNLSRDAYFAIADESQRQRIPFEGHVPYAVTAAEASDAGQRTIEHMAGIREACENRQARLSYDADRCRALADRFQRNGTWLVPTNVMVWRPAGVDLNARRRYAPSQRAGGVDRQISTLDQVPAPGFTQAMRQVGRFLAGTDISSSRPWLLPGFSLQDELALFVEQGYTAVEALQAATLNAAKYRGALDDSGTVEPGKRADLMLLDADPLVDIRNTAKINAVILNGRLLDRMKLDHFLAEGELAASKQKPSPPAPTVTLVVSGAGNTATVFAGTWETDVQGQASVDLKVDGTKLTGTAKAFVKPGFAQTLEVFDGRIDGNTMTFKVKSPDGDRTITFTGTVAGNEIDFTRDVEVVAGGFPGGQGLFGVGGAPRFSARRVK